MLGVEFNETVITLKDLPFCLRGKGWDWVWRWLSLIQQFIEMLQLFFAKRNCLESQNLCFCHACIPHPVLSPNLPSFKFGGFPCNFQKVSPMRQRLVSEITPDFPFLLKLPLGFLISYICCYFCCFSIES